VSELNKEIKYLKGVGEARARLFKKLGVVTLRDLLRYFPRDYEDRTVFKKIAELSDGESVTVRAVASDSPRLSRTPRGRELALLRVYDDTGMMDVRFFNQSYVKDAISAGGTYLFYGKILRAGGSALMTNPVFERDGDGSSVKIGRVTPIYRMTAGLNMRSVSNTVALALKLCGDAPPDALPHSVRKEYGLAAARFAYENIHFPKDFESLKIARRRLIFEDLFVLSVTARRRRAERGSSSGQAIISEGFGEFYSALPFEPTAAQKRAVDEAARDLASGGVMARMLQGDVGSGKTLVAAALAWTVAKNGFQTAFMAPTELLAEQHFRTFEEFLSPLGVRVGRLTGSLGVKAKRLAREALVSGETDVIVGTHALLSEGVDFRALALVITDEQHRFGVSQRAALGQKGESPHVLVMSATPIPRTLALILYGDLDVSELNELPPGRKSVMTYSAGERLRRRIYDFARRLVSEGRQVYFVCPAVEEIDTIERPASPGGDGIEIARSPGTGDSELKRAREYAKQLQTEIFPELSVGLVHGSMKPREKDAAMASFISGETDILVATTVIEVGVDVPNAALIVIENADRFGLSQLHQLRGRVGRGEHQSYCVLMRGADGEKSRERLDILRGTNDGFEIAEADLRQRGPGDFFGSRQHGIPASRFIEQGAEAGTIWDARSAADTVLARDPGLKLRENRALREAVDAIFLASDGTFN
jgi:ATP-dependent DNA helicase RecG